MEKLCVCVWGGGGESMSGFLFFFSAHMTFSGLAIRIHRFLGPSISTQTSTVDGEHSLADNKILASVTHTAITA